jgi:hypothetical protein
LISGLVPRFKDVEILGFEIGSDNIVAVIFALWVGARVGVLTGRGVVRLAEYVSRRVVRWRATHPSAPAPPPEPPQWPPPDWSLSLLVRVDEGEGVIHPSVQVRGAGEERRGRINLELVDAEGAVRLAVKRSFPTKALNTELPLPAFVPPEGATLEDVLRWRWDITLGNGSGEPLRWQEHPSPTGVLNAEAELDQREGASAGQPVTLSRGGLAEPAGAIGLDSHSASRAIVRRARMRRLLLAIALIAYIIVVYSGPTGEVSALRAVLLYGAFAAIWVALWALGTALFADDADLVPEIAQDSGGH